MENPLLIATALPVFGSIIPETHVETAIKQIISQNRAELKELLSSQKTYTWENLMQPLEEMGDRMAKVWSPVSHMHAVVESEALRAVYNACLPLLTEYGTEIMQNTDLFNAIMSISESLEYKDFNPGQRKVIENELRDFRLSGVSLPVEEKAQLAEMQKQLSKLTTLFAENVLDATHAWSFKSITDKNELPACRKSTVG